MVNLRLFDWKLGSVAAIGTASLGYGLVGLVQNPITNQNYKQAITGLGIATMTFIAGAAVYYSRRTRLEIGENLEELTKKARKDVLDNLYEKRKD